ncbi:MAG: FAD-dependent monooxygenase [Microbacteriaceae bacterium]
MDVLNTSTTQDYEVPILIVGGSLVGMTMAMLLGHHGIKSLVVEKHPGTAIHPRAALFLQRSMEILRSAGIEDSVRTKSFEQFEPDGAIMAVETLAGKEIAWYMTHVNDGIRDLSPSERIFVTQIALEPVLRARAQELGADVRFGTELVSFEDDADGVHALIRDRASGTTSTVHAKYMIGADGGASHVRDQLGIPMVGHGVMSNSVTIYFRADVEPLLNGRNLSVIMVVNPVFQGFFRIEMPYKSGFLIVHGLGDPQHPETNVSEGLTNEQCIELVRAGLGVPDIPVQIDDVMRWDATADVAEHFRKGNVFLAGDAAHLMPPYGGYGGNTGIHDAHNLAWKLAMVLRGEAGAELLDTYEVERKPVAKFTVEQSFSRYVGRAAPFLASADMDQVVGDNNIDLGYRYHSAAVVAEGDDSAVQLDPREALGLPGVRAPHVSIERDGEKLSIIDLFGHAPVLLTGSAAAGWAESAREAANALGVKLEIHSIGAGAGILNPDGDFEAAYGITPGGAVLVRPDGVVSWRAKTVDGDPSQPIRAALATTLCLEPVSA